MLYAEQVWRKNSDVLILILDIIGCMEVLFCICFDSLSVLKVAYFMVFLNFAHCIDQSASSLPFLPSFLSQLLGAF